MKYDFRNDWKEHVANELFLLGFNYNDKKDVKENSLNLFNIRRRLPKKKPRKVVFSTEFICPNKNKKGLDILVKKLEKGKCLASSLSKTVSKVTYNDSILDDWGIHHFHLGEHEVNRVIERTENVMFVLILDDCALCLQVLPHGKEHSDVWVNTTLIEIIHNNWPSAISYMRTHTSGTILTSTERMILRKKNVNVNVKTSDGTVYFSLGGGRMSDGTSMRDFMNLQRIFRDIDDFEAIVPQEANKIKSKIKSSTGKLNLRLDCSNVPELSVIEENSKTVLHLKK